MEDEQLLDICLKVTGSFEGGTPRYDAIAGDFDGAGLSCGLLQWNTGSGTLQKLVAEIGAAMGWEKAKAYFATGDYRSTLHATAAPRHSLRQRAFP